LDRSEHATVKCENCKEWGCTISDNFAIPCPKCGRLTWPNLGVNVPAGAAVALSGSRCIDYEKLRQMDNTQSVMSYLFGPKPERTDSLALGIKILFRHSLLRELALEPILASEQQWSQKQRMPGYESGLPATELQLHRLANRKP
jgi:hypothetical protein